LAAVSSSTIYPPSAISTSNPHALSVAGGVLKLIPSVLVVKHKLFKFLKPAYVSPLVSI
jgi:hypothetical protein